MMSSIILPYKYKPRAYQLKSWKALHGGGTDRKRIVDIWHRRAGKDLDQLNRLVCETQKRVGAYWQVLPFYSQARKAVWEGFTADGRRYLDFFPDDIVDSKNNSDMSVKLKNGSIYRLVGSDKVDSLMGAGPAGVIMSEYSLQHPAAWDYIEPMLLENKGWAMFNFTPRGDNHGKDLKEMAENNPKWFVNVQTVEDTGIISEEEIDELRASGKSEEHIQQEYYCSFQGSVEGAYYAKQIQQAKDDGRICKLPVQENIEVHTAWDLGYGDYTAIWFYQKIAPNNIHVIDYYEATSEGMPHYAKILKEKGYLYGTHTAPHDVENGNVGSGVTTKEQAYNVGIDFEVLDRCKDVHPGIDEARSIFNRCWFDEEKCKDGLSSLKNYRKIYDENRKRYHDKPLHDWASDGADAFRYLAMSLKNQKQERRPIKYPYRKLV